MTRWLKATVLLAAGFAIACSDNAGPVVDTQDTEAAALQSHAFRPLSYKPMDAPPQFTATVETENGEGLLEPDGQALWSPSASAPPLTANTMSFWAVKGQTRGIRIDWLDVTKYDGLVTITRRPYLTFSVPSDGLSKGPDGAVYAYGDSVQITVKIDQSAMIAYFEPSGLTFNSDHPALLQYWYTAAGGDFNGNGVVDKEDAYIESSLLKLWTAPNSSSWWVPLWAEQSLSDDYFRAGVDHFSGFAVAY